MFQFANPKAWVMGLALMAGFLPESGQPVFNALVLAGFAEVVALPCIALWAAFGTAIGQWIKSDSRMARFQRHHGSSHRGLCGAYPRLATAQLFDHVIVVKMDVQPFWPVIQRGGVTRTQYARLFARHFASPTPPRRCRRVVSRRLRRIASKRARDLRII